MYISGKGETLKDLYTKDCGVRSFADYSNCFFQRNPHITRPFGNACNVRIPDCTPLCLPYEEIPHTPIKQKPIDELLSWPKEDLQKAQMLQNTHHDVETLLAAQDLLEDYQDYLKSIIPENFAQDFKAANRSSLELADESKKAVKALRRLTQLAKDATPALKLTKRYRNSAELFQKMFEYETLSMELEFLKNQKRVSKRDIAILEPKLKELSQTIKKAFPTQFKNYFTPGENKGIRGNYFPKNRKQAAKSSKAPSLPAIYDRVGLGKFKKLVKHIEKTGETLKSVNTCLTYGKLLLETMDAILDGKDAMRVALAGSAAIVAGAEFAAGAGGVFSALEIMLVGVTGPGGLLATTFLAMHPIVGAIVITVATFIIVGYGTEFVQKVVEQGYDFASNAWDETKKQMNQAWDEITKLWSQRDAIIMSLYR